MIDDGVPPMAVLDLDRLRAVARSRRDEFTRAVPFPHVVIDDFLRREVAARVVAELPAATGEWIYYHHVNERKRGFNDVARMGEATSRVIMELNDSAVRDAFTALTGIRALRADPSLEGGGLSEVEPGGYVNVHADFLSHSRERTWTRRLNLIVFLNEPWTADDGGALELWDRDVREVVRRITPTFNRAVLFATTADAFHGVPTVTCGPGRSRKSLALYYFTDDGAAQPIRSTHYVPRPTDRRARRVLIHLDRLALHAYALLKRYTPFGDRLVSRLLRRL
jgi:Rps23 Pro-64 3,4-dihydroxylase Tpa1-like proline 4-hydroxylase